MVETKNRTAISQENREGDAKGDKLSVRETVPIEKIHFPEIGPEVWAIATLPTRPGWERF